MDGILNSKLDVTFKPLLYQNHPIWQCPTLPAGLLWSLMYALRYAPFPNCLVLYDTCGSSLLKGFSQPFSMGKHNPLSGTNIVIGHPAEA